MVYLFIPQIFGSSILFHKNRSPFIIQNFHNTLDERTASRGFTIAKSLLIHITYHISQKFFLLLLYFPVSKIYLNLDQTHKISGNFPVVSKAYQGGCTKRTQRTSCYPTSNGLPIPKMPYAFEQHRMSPTDLAHTNCSSLFCIA